MTTNKDSLREAIKQIFVKNNMADEDDPMTEFNDVEYFDLEQVINDLGDYFTSHIEEAERSHEIELVKRDIRYHTLKARWQRMYLGGDKDALPTKRYVKRLRKKLEQLKQTKGVE